MNLLRKDGKRYFTRKRLYKEIVTLYMFHNQYLFQILLLNSISTCNTFSLLLFYIRQIISKVS